METLQATLPIPPPVIDFEIRQCPVATIIDLRHAVLRRGFARDSAHYEEDGDPRTLHLALFRRGVGTEEPLACASFVPRELFALPSSWQLRGMASAEGFQRIGFGSALLRRGELILTACHGAAALWCHARLRAVEFYHKQGWEITTDPYDLPPGGMHRGMRKLLVPRY